MQVLMYVATAETTTLSVSRASGCAGLCKTSDDQSGPLQNQIANEERLVSEQTLRWGGSEEGRGISSTRVG